MFNCKNYFTLHNIRTWCLYFCSLTQSDYKLHFVYIIKFSHRFSPPHLSPHCFSPHHLSPHCFSPHHLSPHCFSPHLSPPLSSLPLTCRLRLPLRTVSADKSKKVKNVDCRKVATRNVYCENVDCRKVAARNATLNCPRFLEPRRDYCHVCAKVRAANVVNC